MASSGRPSIRAISAPTRSARSSKFCGQLAAQSLRCRSMLLVGIGAYGLAPCGARQASIKMVFRLLQGKKRQRRGLRVPCLHLFGCLDRRRVVAGEEARLELADPVVTF